MEPIRSQPPSSIQNRANDAGVIDAGPLIAVGPDSLPIMHEALVAAVERGGARVATTTDELADATGLVFADPRAADHFPELVSTLPSLRWVQLPYAGVETFLDHLDPRYEWTCAKGVYAEPVAEHVLGLALAALRDVHLYSRRSSWSAQTGRNLLGANVTVLGAGGITEALLELLEPFRCTTTVVRRNPQPLAGADRTLPTDRLTDAVATADVVVVAWALTEATAGLIDRSVFEAMRPDAWLINVGRGGHVVTDDLVDALHTGQIAGAALDVTDPEPLPDGHPLWSLPNCIITPHVGNTPDMGRPLLAARVEENVRRFVDSDGSCESLVGKVDVDARY